MNHYLVYLNICPPPQIESVPSVVVYSLAPYPYLTPELLADLALPPDSIFESILSLSEVHDSLHSLSLGIEDKRTILFISLLPCRITEGMYLNNLLIERLACNQNEPSLTGRCIGFGELDPVFPFLGSEDESMVYLVRRCVLSNLDVTIDDYH